ncbi:MarR family winged helix-turn-helix transcriptional regulator [Amycolatopsis jiangsuensis]|uniref:DNA-binding MarR family transcriptional regulator n=1 Tax=Amycolatopsis jiangsuensis TaxID=1181879 RepID=A0A840IZE8_9PSEU|nr:MarR family winged helix-turn-helix transcriptional regulator [Amycolatopsis jiangsuensis]MBB4687190.1 DNA-binding MarR family transcriptional regulator [Amycolatopsis jiangsuensis]
MSTSESIETDLGCALFAVVRRYRQLTDDLLADLPAGPRGYQVLMTAQLGGPKNQVALAQYLGVDRTVMTYLLDDMEEAGLVERKPDPADRRARRIELTEQGAAALYDAHRRLQSAETALLEPLGPADSEAFRALLQRLAGSEAILGGLTRFEAKPVAAKRRSTRKRV